jgi:hypothetical protein
VPDTMSERYCPFPYLASAGFTAFREGFNDSVSMIPARPPRLCAQWPAEATRHQWSVVAASPERAAFAARPWPSVTERRVRRGLGVRWCWQAAVTQLRLVSPPEYADPMGTSVELHAFRERVEHVRVSACLCSRRCRGISSTRPASTSPSSAGSSLRCAIV